MNVVVLPASVVRRSSPEVKTVWAMVMPLVLSSALMTVVVAVGSVVCRRAHTQWRRGGVAEGS